MQISNSMKKALHFGAGNIGRGFIGLVLNQSGYALSFADVNAELIETLNKQRKYSVKTLESNSLSFSVDVSYSYDISNKQDKLIAAMLNFDLITTAVGPNILSKIAPIFARFLDVKFKANDDSFLNIIACENVVGGSEILRNEIFKLLDNKTIEFAKKYVGFPNSAVDRIVPNQPLDDSLVVNVGPYFEWIIDSTKIKGDLSIDQVTLTDNLEAFIERKLYLVNAGHAAIAYAGYLKGYETIVESLQDISIYDHVFKQMMEAANLLSKKHDFDVDDLKKFAIKTLDRFKNPYINDSIYRVARSPIRKLSPNDRFIKPLNELYQFKLKAENFEKSILDALQYSYEEDDEAVKLQTMIKEDGLIMTLSIICNINKNHPFLNLLN